MPVSPGHFTLTPEQQQFAQMLEGYSSLTPFWNFNTRDCDLQATKRSIPAMSHGEQIMARFFTAVWLDENKFDLDLIDAAKTLHPQQRQLISTGCLTRYSRDEL